MNLDPNEILIIAEMSKCSASGMRVDCASRSLSRLNHVRCEFQVRAIMLKLFGRVAEKDFDPKWRW